MEDQSKLDFKQTLSALLRSNRRHVRYVQILACLALVVAVAVPLAFRQHGVAMTTTETRLSCHYSGAGAHTHNEDCYDAEGNLVCPLEERELHTHTDECYATERVLACGKEETAGHTHSADCYDAEGNLTYTLAEEPAHKHSDACYEEHVTDELVCGLEEVTEEHVHGPACFETVQVPTPAQDLTGELKVKDENGNEHVALIAQVKAPEGTLPKGTTMRVEAVDLQARETPDGPTVQDKLDEALLAEAGEAAAFTQTDAVKITFYDEQGNRVDPADKVEILITTSAIRTFSDQRTAGDEAANDNGLLVLRVPDAQHGDAASAEVIRGTGLVNQDENDTSTGHEDTVLFEADSSSVYVVARVDYAAAKAEVEAEAQPAEAEAEVQSVESEAKAEVPQAEPKQEATTEATPEVAPQASGPTHPAQSFTHRFTNSGGKELLRVDVAAPEGAFPAGTTMKVKWVDAGDVEGAVSEAVSGRTDGKLLGMCAVDITFLDPEGNEIEPAKKITVTFASDFIDTEDDSYVVHIDDKGKGEVVDALGAKDLEKRDIADQADELVFESDAFSTYVVAVTTLRKELAAGDGKTYEVTVDAPAEAGIPQDVELRVSEIVRGTAGYEDYLDRALQALGKDAPANGTASARFFDIKIMSNGEELQPQAPVKVSVQLADAAGATAASAVHFESDAKGAAEVMDATQEGDVTTFDATGFSVYGVIYTVDFHWDVDGKAYDYSIQGGDAQSLRELLVALKVVEDVEADAFMAQVSDVAFSDPELVNVAKVEENTTAGALKKELKLQPEYSDGLTEEDIAAMDAKELTAGDWALVSLKAFDTIESLTVTMVNGDAFTIMVTDAQISTRYISDEGELYEVTVTYGEDAGIPERSTLRVTELTYESDEYKAAYDKVVEYKKNNDADFSEVGMGFEALDISIVGPDGSTVEPSSQVHVSIKRKTLPEAVDEETFIETVEVQHIVKSKTDSTVDVVANATDLVAGDVTISDGAAVADFTVDSFSTYTISWGGGQTISTPSYLYAVSANTNAWYFDDEGKSVGYREVNTNNLYIMGSDRMPVTNGVVRSNNGTPVTADIYLVYTRTTANPNVQEASVANSTFHIYFGTGWPNYSRFADVTVHYVDDSGKRIARTQRQDVTFTGNSFETSTIFSGYMGAITGYANPHVEFRGAVEPPAEVTVHYGYMDGNTFVEFDDLPEGAQTSYGGPTRIGDQLNVRYDFEGKDYVTTRINNPSTGTQISPLLQTEAGSATYWKYRVQTTNGDITEWQPFNDNDNDIYVIYRDTPTEKSYDDQGLNPEDLAAPATNKDVQNNGNGTYDIGLSVTGTSNSMTNKTHANVVIVLDTSSSMNGTDTGVSGKNRLDVAKDAIGSLADQLFGFNTDDDPAAIEVAFVNFSHRVRNEQTLNTIYSGTSSDAFKAMINATSENGGTNYDTAIEAANSILWNDADPVYVIFVTDGDTVSRGYLEYDESGATDHASDWDGGTYYTGDTATYGDTYLERARSAAKLQVDKILADGNNKFYSIGVFGNVQYLEALGGTYLGQANEQDKIEEAFAEIVDQIALDLGYKDVTIHDGITAMTSTTLVNGTADQFRYEITKKDGTKKEYANGAALHADYPGIGLAEYDSTEKAVKWELGESYQLEDGVTYKVIFTVWPSQDAYDLLAELNNGTKDFDTLADAVKDQIVVEEGKYYLKTNTYSTVDYTSFKMKDGQVVDTTTVTGAEIKDPKGKMILDGTGLEMEKAWNDDLDPTQLLELLTDHLNADKTDTTYQVVLRLWQDKGTTSEKEVVTSDYPSPNGFIYKPTVTIVNDEVTAATWPTVDVAIAPGVLVTITEENEDIYSDTTRYPRITHGGTTYAMLETGHTYVITEDNTDLHFELNTDVYHPMVVDGKLKTVKFSSDGTSITEMSADNTELSTLTATNDLKGGLQVHKYVTTKDDKSDTVTTDTSVFTFKIKLQKSATDTTPVYTTPDQFNQDGSTILGSLGLRIFASPDIPEGATNVAADKSSYEYEGNTFRANFNSENEITGYTARGTIPSSGELTLKIRQSDVIRIVNVPANTYYTVEEVTSASPEGYELVDSSGDTGTVPANTQALAEFWNKRASFTVDLLKVDELAPEKVLADAEFKLFNEDGETPVIDADGNTVGTIKTNSEGKAVIGKLLPGKYQLVETVAPKGYNLMSSPITFEVTNDKVTYQQGLKQPADAEKSSDGLTWTITATNNAGVELPHTGGPGTYLYTLCGLALFASAGYVGIASRRKESKEAA